MADSAAEGRIKLPQRSTRGKRLRAQLEEEEDQADTEFWNQEFFAEEARDVDYVSEKEEEDVPDSDFFESESEVDDDEVEVRAERKKKTLKPPGAPPSRPKPPRPPAPKAPRTPASGSPGQAAAAASDAVPHSVIFEATYTAPTLRKSTRERMEVAQREREQRDQLARAVRRPQRQGDSRVLTQEELLAEAARTELENLASLKQLLAQEEETKRKANVKKQRFGGPLVKMRSRAIEVLVPPQQPAMQPPAVTAGLPGVPAYEMGWRASAADPAALAAAGAVGPAAAAAAVVAAAAGAAGAVAAPAPVTADAAAGQPPAEAAAVPAPAGAGTPAPAHAVAGAATAAAGSPAAAGQPVAAAAAGEACPAVAASASSDAAAAGVAASSTPLSSVPAVPGPAPAPAHAASAADQAAPTCAEGPGAGAEPSAAASSAVGADASGPPATADGIAVAAPAADAGVAPPAASADAGAAADGAATAAAAAATPGSLASTPAPADAVLAAGADGTTAAAATPAATGGEQQPASAPQEAAAAVAAAPAGPTLERIAFTTLQCCGMRAPKWLQPQRAPAPVKPTCAITGVPARYKDPLTGHYYANLDAFIELRRRLGAPLPDTPSRNRDALLAADASILSSSQQQAQPGSAADGAAGGGVAGAGTFPAWEQQLETLVAQQMQQQVALVGMQRAKSGRNSSMYYQQEVAVPDEVAALVVHISNAVHGAA